MDVNFTSITEQDLNNILRNVSYSGTAPAIIKDAAPSISDADLAAFNQLIQGSGLKSNESQAANARRLGEAVQGANITYGVQPPVNAPSTTTETSLERTITNSLNQGEARTIFYNGQEVDVDANGNVVETRPYQGGSGDTPKNGSLITSQYSDLSEEQVAEANNAGPTNVFTEELTDNAGYGSLNQAQRDEILATQTSAQEEIFNSEEYAALSEDQQAMLRQMFDVISVNDDVQAQQLLESFEAARGLSEPFFAQQIALVRDELERGFVSAENELEFRSMQYERKLADLREDVANAQEFLTLEQQSQIAALERDLEVRLDQTRNQLAAKGFTFSSRRAEAEALLEDTTGSLIESANRKFGAKQEELANELSRGERDTASELARLQELGDENKLDLARQGEAQLGSQIMGGLSNVPVLGGNNNNPIIQGSINQKMSQDILSGAYNIFDRKQGQSSFA